MAGRSGGAILACALLLSAAAVGSAEALPPGFVDQLVVSGLSAPTAIAVAPDGRQFVTEQKGAVRVVRDRTLLAAPFVKLNVDSDGERGLLGIALHPAFASNHFIYVYHTVPGTPPHNRVTRFTADGNVARPGSARVILELKSLSIRTNHNGGGLHFGPDGKLYVGVGENGESSNAQSLNNRLGKILRLNPDGSIPANNPAVFPGIAGRTQGVTRAIWAVGLRNPYTFAFQRHSGTMFINDVGAQTWEEVNRGVAGRNYGWPISEGPTRLSGQTSPVYAYQHSSGTPTGCAITGGTFYNPTTSNFPKRFTGKYFFADFCGNWIYYLDPASPGSATLFQSGLNRPVDLAVGTGGSLLYIQRGDGQLRRIRFIG